MRLAAQLEVTGVVCDVEIEFTSCSKEGVHYFKMVKPVQEPSVRFKWEPHEGNDRSQALVEAIVWVYENNKPKWWRLP